MALDESIHTGSPLAARDDEGELEWEVSSFGSFNEEETVAGVDALRIQMWREFAPMYVGANQDITMLKVPPQLLRTVKFVGVRQSECKYSITTGYQEVSTSLVEVCNILRELAALGFFTATQQMKKS